MGRCTLPTPWTTALTAAALLAAAVGPADPAASAAEAVVKCPVTRDVWVSAYPGEEDGNNGGEPRLKTKGIQEFFLLDFDPAPLRGRVVTGATLHLAPRSADPQRRLTVSTVATGWVEGTSRGYKPQKGSASFRWARQEQTPWAWPGSDLTAAAFGGGNTLWRFAEASPVGADGFQVVPVEPAVLAARTAGVSHGLAVMDDVGSEYSRAGEKFDYKLFPNRFVASREAGPGLAPYLTVYLGPRDDKPPGAVTDLAAEGPPPAALLPAGQAKITWTTPADEGPAGTVGFLATVAGGAGGAPMPVPQWLVPAAGQPGRKVTMHLRDLPALKPGGTVTLEVRAVDGAGNAGPATRLMVKLSQGPAAIRLPVPPAGAATPGTAAAVPALPRIGEAELFIVDELDKVHPVSGRIIPEPASGADYAHTNHLWSARDRRIRLFAARGETVAFQVVLRGKAEVSIRVTRPRVDSREDPRHQPTDKVHRFHYVNTPAGPLPEVLSPWDGQGLSLPGKSPAIPGQTHAAALVELHVPSDHPAGSRTYHWTLELAALGQRLEIPLELRMWDFALPDHLSFIPQMNAYGLPGPAMGAGAVGQGGEADYYRLAHEHRTTLNCLRYNWKGEVRDGTAAPTPGPDGRWDWTAWDRRFGPLLDGSLFADLPRKGVPVEAFYLPLNENWPVDIHRHFQGGYWADQAFAREYRPQFVAACRRFAEHLAEKGWDRTFFEFYLNNKVYHKKERGGWSGSSAPWVFDEPVNTQDFWALRWFGRAFHEGVAAARQEAVSAGRPFAAHLAFRADISRPQWQRDLLDGLLDVNVVGGSFHRYQRLVLDRKARWGEVTYIYGSSNAPDQPNTQPAAWALDAWSGGADGVLPWQTIGTDKSWTQGDALALFYPGGPAGSKTPLPSVRLKAYRRGQQDVEYLALLAAAAGQPRWHVGNLAREHLKLAAGFTQAGGDDAGRVDYRGVTPAALWDLRVRVGVMLEGLKPAARKQTFDLTPPPRDLAGLPDLGYVTVLPTDQ